ncbi:hypothetical protein ACE1B6_16160 [Aerosakkonemataceae cyanobacterium BLCC-F154]|uniref:Uncharacterized protein n=1 Tax=Floridaenema fluviatile BLCC-F154 TaxID=3153640 RepID=A0ABV4YD81_9CYAN
MDSENGCGLGCLLLLGLVAGYWVIGWLSILISINQGWFAGLGLILIIIGISLGISWYVLKEKAYKLNEISKELTDNWE